LGAADFFAEDFFGTVRPDFFAEDFFGTVRPDFFGAVRPDFLTDFLTNFLKNLSFLRSSTEKSLF